MRYGHPSQDLLESLADAMIRLHNAGVKGIQSSTELEVDMFSQMWGSTSLGFGGIGGQAMTSAYTVLVWAPNRDSVFVYFAGRFAYEVKNYSDYFRECYAARRMPEVGKRHRLEKP
jgi:hypothetical protein